MYTLTLNTMAERAGLLPSCDIWLPHIRCISERLERLRPRLSQQFEPEFSVYDPYLNPLYTATQDIDDILQQIGTFTNATALEELRLFYSLSVGTTAQITYQLLAVDISFIARRQPQRYLVFVPD